MGQISMIEYFSLFCCMTTDSGCGTAGVRTTKISNPFGKCKAGGSVSCRFGKSRKKFVFYGARNRLDLCKSERKVTMRCFRNLLIEWIE